MKLFRVQYIKHAHLIMSLIYIYEQGKISRFISKLRKEAAGNQDLFPEEAQTFVAGTSRWALGLS